jgi:hypothetical protein
MASPAAQLPTCHARPRGRVCLLVHALNDGRTGLLQLAALVLKLQGSRTQGQQASEGGALPACCTAAE